MNKCHYCGRIWPTTQIQCWDGANGCGASLDILKNETGNETEIKFPTDDFLRNHVTIVRMDSTVSRCKSNGKYIELVAHEVDDIDRAILWGTGCGEPLGIMKAPALIEVNRNRNHWTISWEDLVGMLECFSPVHGIWLVSKSAWGGIMQSAGFKDGVYLSYSTEPPKLFGYPLLKNIHCADMGKRGDVLLVDLRYYLLGEFYDNDHLLIDGKPMITEPMYNDDGVRQTSPFVALSRWG